MKIRFKISEAPPVKEGEVCEKTLSKLEKEVGEIVMKAVGNGNT